MFVLNSGRRRDKVFGHGRPLPLDREAKLRIKVRARALSRRTQKGKHYGVITAKALDVLDALLWRFHNARSGLCFPSHQAIAEAAGCAVSTVQQAIKTLEAAGLLTWVNRIIRVRAEGRVRLFRTSNAYKIIDPKSATIAKSSDTEIQGGTMNQDINYSLIEPAVTPLEIALLKLRHSIKTRNASSHNIHYGTNWLDMKL
jgi:DNA-binding transcriptional regulator YhcF (GntR family)